MAYESWTSHFFANRAATIFFAIYRAIYAAERSTFVQSFPEKAPPPCLAYPPYVSTIILRPVRPVSPCGPPITKRPVGFIYIRVFSSLLLNEMGGFHHHILRLLVSSHPVSSI